MLQAPGRLSTTSATQRPIVGRVMQEIDICINGAGPVGAALAIRLAKAGLRVLIIDRVALPEAVDPSLDGRTYALSEGSRRMLEGTGLWARLSHKPQPIREISVSEGLVGRPPSCRKVCFTSDDAPQDSAGPMPFGWMIEARDLRGALNHALRDQKSLALAVPDQAQFIFTQDTVQITLASGKTYVAQLAIGAEGRLSPLRSRAGIRVTRLPYHQCGLIATIAHERPHHDRALEHFLPQGPFARLPLAPDAQHPHRSAIVWTEAAKRAERLFTLDDATLSCALMKRLGDDVGAARVIGRRWIYPLSAQYAHRYVAPRLALVGDAAHGLHPIAGQGLNMGFRDVEVLSRLLEAQSKRGDDFGAPDLLMRYQREVRPNNMGMLAACDQLERLFRHRNPLLRRARSLGLDALEHLPAVKKSFVKKAMGL